MDWLVGYFLPAFSPQVRRVNGGGGAGQQQQARDEEELLLLQALASVSPAPQHHQGPAR